MKDIKLRYKGSFLGILWSWINPLLMMFVFYLVFNVILPPDVPKDCSETTPGLVGTKCRIYNHYAAFILTGILAWNFTSAAVSQGMMAVLGNASLIKKVYFPREVLTISSVLGIFVNFLLSFVVLFPIELINGVNINMSVLLLPVVLAFHLLFMLGVALFLSALVVYFRDLTNIIEVLLTAWFFLTPVLYTMKQVYQSFNGIDTAQVVYWLNPIASFIELYRNILFFNYPTDPLFAVRTFASAIVTFVVGYVFFIKTTRSLGERL